MDCSVVQGDITEQDVDAIVNAANTDIQMGGGVALAIREAAGEAVQKEANEKSPINLGAATWTKGYDLSAEYVIHTATMELGGCSTEETIRGATTSALEVGDELKCHSITLPALGCGTGGVPLETGAPYIFDEISEYEPINLEDVRVIGYGTESFHTLDEAKDSVY